MPEYPSLRQLADQLSELPVYAPLREHIRGTIDAALGAGSKRPAELLTEKECVIHCLVAEWLDSKGYKASAQTMKVQMADKWIDEPKRYLKGKDTVDSLLESLDINSVQIERTLVKESPPFPKILKIERKKQAIKISPMTDEQLEETMRARAEVERKRKALQERRAALSEAKKDDSDDSDDSSDDSTSEEDRSQEEESGSDGKHEEEEEGSIQPLSWGPSKLALVTDEVSDPLPAIFSAHLPPLSMSKPVVTKTEEDAIDALFGDDYDLEDFEELGEEEVEDVDGGKAVVEESGEEEAVKEEASEEKEETEKKDVEPLVLSEGESIDELEEFDTGLLSSGGSDYSF